MPIVPRYVLFAALILPASALAEEFPFSDVPFVHSNSEAIEYVKAQGIVEGYSDGTFRPDAEINRAEFTKIVVGSVASDAELEACDPSILSYFSDVPTDEWYSPYVCIGRARAILQGHIVTNGKPYFAPDERISAVEAFKIVTASLGVGEPPLDCAAEWGRACLEAGARGERWFERHVRAMADRNAIPVSISSIQQYVTRGEMAEMVYRLKTGNDDKESRSFDEIMPEHTMQVIAYKYSSASAEACGGGYVSDCSYVPFGFTVPWSRDVLKASLDILIHLPLDHGACFDADCNVISDFRDSDLTVTSASVIDGVARVRIDGRLSSGGVSADVRMKQEIERTIRQFPEVEELDITVAGVPWHCFVDESGMCE